MTYGRDYADGPRQQAREMSSQFWHRRRGAGFSGYARDTVCIVAWNSTDPAPHTLFWVSEDSTVRVWMQIFSPVQMGPVLLACLLVM